jgi:hypothetical protein
VTQGHVNCLSYSFANPNVPFHLTLPLIAPLDPVRDACPNTFNGGPLLHSG